MFATIGSSRIARTARRRPLDAVQIATPIPPSEIAVASRKTGAGTRPPEPPIQLQKRSVIASVKRRIHHHVSGRKPRTAGNVVIVGCSVPYTTRLRSHHHPPNANAVTV